ncbi:hypothetical protein [Estrella lausannensis]|uniref:hypothetical protein n=1 Tax=Estrella lausannensis TaxID=483423 RepID=UPI000BF1A2B2|nr:hypothetical protein [Estrella lausannensis]
MSGIVQYAVALVLLLTGVSVLECEDEHVYSRGYPGADIVFLAADLKYNPEEGVKICEIQSGSCSAFNGFDYVMGEEGLFAKTFCQILGQYQTSLWFTPSLISDTKLKAEFARQGFTPVTAFSDLQKSASFKQAVNAPFYNPADVRSYHGIFYTSKLSRQQCEKFARDYPSILLMDRVAMPYLLDKLPMTELFLDENLKRYKPRWNVYKKKYSADLAERICQDIGSEIFVIKPRKSALGKGIVITDRSHLDQVLKTILHMKSQDLRNQEIPEYRYWAYDRSDSFIVEAFLKGNPMKVEELGGGTYDGIVRILFLLVQSEEKLHIHYLPAVMIIPKKSLEETGSLTDRHKSVPKAPYFTKVPEEVLNAVQEQLNEMLPILYRKMVDSL